MEKKEKGNKTQGKIGLDNTIRKRGEKRFKKETNGGKKRKEQKYKVRTNGQAGKLPSKARGQCQ